MGDDEEIYTVDEFCIETAARRLHARLVDRLLHGDGSSPVDERRAELLREFLEKEDFARIRAEDLELAGGHHAQVRVYRGHDGLVRWSKL